MSSENVSEVKKASFWVSHLFIILATVIGVFLAANQGLKQAILFDDVRCAKNNYYLRKSLQSELADNVGYIKEFIAKVERRVDKPELVLESFVWKNMAFSSATLETPSELLREAKLFYRKAEEIMNTPYYNNYNKAEFLGELAKHVEEQVLPKFDEDAATLRKKIQDYGTDV